MTAIVLGDVGGTNIRLQLVPGESIGSALPLATHQARYSTAEFGHLRDALSKFAREAPSEAGRIVACALSVCGPVSEGRAVCLAQSMGPDGWVLEEADLGAALGLGGGRLRMLNDFVAVGLAVGSRDRPAGAPELLCVHEAALAPQGTIAVLGPGTGLGSCFGVWFEAPAGGAAELQIFPSEGGESDFVARLVPPRTLGGWGRRPGTSFRLTRAAGAPPCHSSEREWALRQHVAASLDVTHVKVEHVVSGSGLARIYLFLRSEGAAGLRSSTFEHDDGGVNAPYGDAAAAAAVEAEVRAAADPSAAVAARGTPGEVGADEYCVAALDLFLHVLGAEAANLALRFQAHGGVFLAGGVMAKLAPCLRARGGAALARLRQSYLGKGHSVAAYKQCPLYVVGIEGDALAMEGVWAFASGAKCGFRRWAQSGAVE